MDAPETHLEPISDLLIDTVGTRLAQDKRIRRRLPGGGQVNIDRRLPFLCVYRQPPDVEDDPTAALLTGEAAFLITSAAPEIHKSVSRLVRTIAEPAARLFGAFLIVEIWPGSEQEIIESVHPESGEPVPLGPGFRIRTRVSNTPFRTAASLDNALRRIRVAKQLAEVDVDVQTHGHPPDLPPLLPPSEARQHLCHVIGIEVRPIYRDPITENVYPTVLRTLRRGFGRALRRAFFTFAQTRTNVRPEHFYALGRRTLVRAVWEVDRQLAHISDSFDFLLQATPVNSDAAWRDFRKSGFTTPPVFHYRQLSVEPALLKRRLFAVPLERIEDPTISHLFRQKQDEVDRKITMLADVGTSRFLHGSLQVYGGIEPSLLELANELLRRISPRSREDSAQGSLDAKAFTARAFQEIEYYRHRFAGFTATATIRDDMYSGLLVSNGDLLIGRETRIPVSRVEALLSHEIGTHSVTYYNGRAQPFRQLHSGLAGYDELQEGLAVLAEYLCGGLSRPRLRLLAARVVAIHAMTSGASFTESFRLLHETHDFPQRTSFTIVTRVYRGGGLTKDAVYLRGLVEILRYLADGGDLEPLFVGKIAVEHVPLIRELMLREVLRTPPLRPRYMELPGVAEKLKRLRQGLTVLDLIQGRIDENRVRRERRADRTGRVHDHAARDGRREPGP